MNKLRLRPFCSQLRLDVRDRRRQTDVRQHHLLNTAGGGQSVGVNGIVLVYRSKRPAKPLIDYDWLVCSGRIRLNAR